LEVSPRTGQQINPRDYVESLTSGLGGLAGRPLCHLRSDSIEGRLMCVFLLVVWHGDSGYR
jgi:hypothetical protein